MLAVASESDNTATVDTAKWAVTFARNRGRWPTVADAERHPDETLLVAVSEAIRAGRLRPSGEMLRPAWEALRSSGETAAIEDMLAKLPDLAERVGSDMEVDDVARVLGVETVDVGMLWPVAMLGFGLVAHDAGGFASRVRIGRDVDHPRRASMLGLGSPRQGGCGPTATPAITPAITSPARRPSPGRLGAEEPERQVEMLLPFLPTTLADHTYATLLVELGEATDGWIMKTAAGVRFYGDRTPVTIRTLQRILGNLKKAAVAVSSKRR